MEMDAPSSSKTQKGNHFLGRGLGGNRYGNSMSWCPQPYNTMNNPNRRLFTPAYRGGKCRCFQPISNKNNLNLKQFQWTQYHPWPSSDRGEPPTFSGNVVESHKQLLDSSDNSGHCLEFNSILVDTPQQIRRVSHQSREPSSLKKSWGNEQSRRCTNRAVSTALFSQCQRRIGGGDP